MRLSTFIKTHMEQILAEWDTFARAHEPGLGGMSQHALRDHAREMLNHMAVDMESAQNAQEQQHKSEGDEERSSDGESAAALHGHQRHVYDYSLLQLTAEFRALRATVLRLWEPHMAPADGDALRQVVRFNEAIDEALAKSVIAWSERTKQTRELFLAILGHDLRSPLASVALAGDMLTDTNMPPEKVGVLGLNVTRATRIMSAMINDLMGYTRAQLGGGMPHHSQTCDLVSALNEAATDAAATYPGVRFEVDAPTELVGNYDRTRLYQMFLNLLVNAARHSVRECPVVVRAKPGPTGYQVSITNRGDPIPGASLEAIFRPLVQLGDSDTHLTRPRTSLGLGLFIARKIAERHGGSIAVASSEAEGTTFTVTLPKVGEALAPPHVGR